LKFRRPSAIRRVVGVLIVISLAFLGNSQGLLARTAKKTAPGARPMATEAGRKNAILEGAMSRCEDLTEYAEAGKVKDMDQAIGALERQKSTILGALSPDTGKHFEAALNVISQKRASGDFPGVALEAVETYRLLAMARDRGKLKVPLEVDLLDYAGFKVKVLSRRQPTDWQALKEVATEAEKNWQAIRGKVADKSLVNVVNTTMAGLSQAIEGKNNAMTRFAGQEILDLVDLLEQQFKRQKR
jgi:hypothetical protein